MTISATATIENDVNFTLIKTGSNVQNESAETNYQVSLSSGSGSLQINYGVISSGTLPSGGSVVFDLRALDKRVFGTTSTIQFSKVKSITVENRETSYGADMAIHATGSNAFTEPWNNGSGNQLIKPYAAWQYSDPISGSVVDSSNRYFTLQDAGGTGAVYAMVVVGITG